MKKIEPSGFFFSLRLSSTRFKPFLSYCVILR